MFCRKAETEINDRSKYCCCGGVTQCDPVSLQRERDQPKQRKMSPISLLNALSKNATVAAMIKSHALPLFSRRLRNPQYKPAKPKAAASGSARPEM